MSSATSIKGARHETVEKRQRPERGAQPPSESFKPWHFFVLVSLLGATAAVVMAKQPSPEHLVLLSLTIGAAGICGAALYATLVPLVRKDPEAGRPLLSDRIRTALEREKLLVLRSIKELEFDRAMGKMTPSDFDDLVGRLRVRAIALMKQLDTGEIAGPADSARGLVTPEHREQIEQELAARLEKAGLSGPRCSCGTGNDADAAFCKRCGKRLQPERAAESPSESERGWGPASSE
jgi:hypothetical protein